MSLMFYARREFSPVGSLPAGSESWLMKVSHTRESLPSCHFVSLAQVFSNLSSSPMQHWDYQRKVMKDGLSWRAKPIKHRPYAHVILNVTGDGFQFSIIWLPWHWLHQSFQGLFQLGVYSCRALVYPDSCYDGDHVFQKTGQGHVVFRELFPCASQGLPNLGECPLTSCSVPSPAFRPVPSYIQITNYLWCLIGKALCSTFLYICSLRYKH